MDTENKMTYVLITPARNEEAFIEKTIKSVIAQTVLPYRWVIVSDGSTDRTDEIVKQYASRYDWILFLRMPEHRDRQFAAKVGCFNAGYQIVGTMHYDVVGNIDADVSFDQGYFEFLLEKFSTLPNLGVAGTPFIENGYNSIRDSFEGEKHVPGGCQLFRRECFEDIGGYVPNKAGGIDWIAVTTARMRGWQTLSFRGKYFVHHRALGTGGSTRIGALFDYGMKDYYLGGHPLWEMFRILFRLGKKPYVIGSVSLLLGYLWALLTRMERPVSRDLKTFHRQEQMQKLQTILKSLLRFKKLDTFHLNS